MATAIRIGNPASWKLAEAARDESGGLIDCVSDQEILDAYQLLSGKEGIFVEPASAASVAGLRKMVSQGKVDLSDSTVVCVLTGNGLKDPDTAVKLATQVLHVPASLEAVEKALRLGVARRSNIEVAAVFENRGDLTSHLSVFSIGAVCTCGGAARSALRDKPPLPPRPAIR